MNEIEERLLEMARFQEEQARKKAELKNEAPCVVCGGKDFVQKFRNVVGGSISGSINGNTKTLPILSCRKCGNEREVATWDFVYLNDIFWDLMHQFYFGIYDNDDSGLKHIDKFFLERPIETREYMLTNKNYCFDFYNEMPYWDTVIWARAGFKIPKIIKKYFIFWKKEVYPKWEELIKE